MANRIECLKNEHGEYVDMELVDSPLWWHEQGLQQTASGYGRKLTQRYKVHYAGKLRRVYLSICSNIGSLYVIVDGQARYL